MIRHETDFYGVAGIRHNPMVIAKQAISIGLYIVVLQQAIGIHLCLWCYSRAGATGPVCQVSTGPLFSPSALLNSRPR